MEGLERRNFLMPKTDPNYNIIFSTIGKKQEFRVSLVLLCP
jgi:hypothetical protein